MIYTATHRTTTSRGSHAHQVREIEHTDIHIDGEHRTTITWNSALLRRLERDDVTREEYIDRIAHRNAPPSDPSEPGRQAAIAATDNDPNHTAHPTHW